jgi:hypothetical protein
MKTFWRENDTGPVSFSNVKLRKFLDYQGFRLYQTTESRTDTRQLVFLDKGIIKEYNSRELKTYIRRFLEEHFVDEEYEDLLDDLLEILSNYSTDMLEKKVIPDLPIISESHFENTEQVNLFRDTKCEGHFIFRNGVVKVTADDIVMVGREDIEDKGLVWESSILDHDISLEEDQKNSVFDLFVRKSMMRKIPSTNVKSLDWVNNFEFSDESQDSYQSLKSAYGYLLHKYNPPDNPKAVIFTDSTADGTRARGGNGKSFVMDSIKHHKKTIQEDGKRFSTGKEGGGRFCFSSVTMDTQFLYIDDIQKNFPLQNIYVTLSGDMTVERKGRDKFIISRENKPKIGLTSNYPTIVSDVSSKRRKHIVEFGNFWSEANAMGESPADEKHLGHMLFDDWNEKQWNQFYLWGIKCVQQYLKNGLVEANISNATFQGIVMELEGLDGDGTVVGWIKDWLENRRHQCDANTHGISKGDLFTLFQKDHPELSLPFVGKMNQHKLNELLFRFIELSNDGYEYNPHKSNKGDRLAERRWQKKVNGTPIDYIKVTHPDDFQEDTSNDPLSVFAAMAQE